MLFVGVFFFFITFYRLSLFYPSFYLACIPAFFGMLLFFNSLRTRIIFSKKSIKIFALFILLFLYCGVLDYFQNNISLEASFSFRILLICILSFFPAYFLQVLFVRDDVSNLNKIIKYAFILQTLIFIIMFINPSLKIFLYTIFGLKDSVNLSGQNLLTRGFGLSSEINFMSPFLMVYISFLVLKRDLLLKIIIFLTQLINSNMVLIAGGLGLLFGGANASLKLLSFFLVIILYYIVGEVVIQEYLPRFYDEYLEGGGGRTVSALLSEHMFAVQKIDLFSFLFGFQENVSSSVVTHGRFSDIGWVIMFNYGGVFLIFLFLLILFVLSASIFKNKIYIMLWFLIGVLFNTKGMIIGMNGFFFLSFLLLLSKKYSGKGIAEYVHK